MKIKEKPGLHAINMNSRVTGKSKVRTYYNRIRMCKYKITRPEFSNDDTYKEEVRNFISWCNENFVGPAFIKCTFDYSKGRWNYGNDIYFYDEMDYFLMKLKK